MYSISLHETNTSSLVPDFVKALGVDQRRVHLAAEQSAASPRRGAARRRQQCFSAGGSARDEATAVGASATHGGSKIRWG